MLYWKVKWEYYNTLKRFISVKAPRNWSEEEKLKVLQKTIADLEARLIGLYCTPNGFTYCVNPRTDDKKYKKTIDFEIPLAGEKYLITANLINDFDRCLF